MIIDLTLDSLKFPGLENYTPPFGTKKSDNVGLTTLEGCNNIAKPWQDQRPIVISENSSVSGNIERNALIVIDTANINIVLTSGAFIGVKLEFLFTLASGSASVIAGSVTYPIVPGERRTLSWDGSAWWNDTPGTKIGVVDAYLGATDPESGDALILDGRDTTGTDIELMTVYPRLYRFLGNSNILPDYRGEFLRGAGPNSHTGEGSGGTVGEHQAGTIHINSRTFSDGIQTSRNAWYPQNPDVRKSSAAEPVGNFGPFGWTGTDSSNYVFTSRPTNTSINWIICAR